MTSDPAPPARPLPPPAPTPAPRAGAGPDRTAAGGATPGPGSGLRERKKRETARRLWHAALRLVAEHGLAGVTVEEIASAAGVSTRTFFNYYPSKEAAVVGAAADLPERLTAELLARPPQECPLAALHAVLRHRLALHDVDPAAHRLRAQVMRDVPELCITGAGAGLGVERALAAGVAQRLGVAEDEDPYPVLVTAAALGAFRAAVATSEPTPAGLLAVLDGCIERLRAGIETCPSREGTGGPTVRSAGPGRGRPDA